MGDPGSQWLGSPLPRGSLYQIEPGVHHSQYGMRHLRGWEQGPTESLVLDGH